MHAAAPGLLSKQLPSHIQRREYSTDSKPNDIYIILYLYLLYVNVFVSHMYLYLYLHFSSFKTIFIHFGFQARKTLYQL